MAVRMLADRSRHSGRLVFHVLCFLLFLPRLFVVVALDSWELQATRLLDSHLSLGCGSSSD